MQGLKNLKELMDDPKYAAEIAAEFAALQKQQNDIQKGQNEAQEKLRCQFHDSFCQVIDDLLVRTPPLYLTCELMLSVDCLLCQVKRG